MTLSTGKGSPLTSGYNVCIHRSRPADNEEPLPSDRSNAVGVTAANSARLRPMGCAAPPWSGTKTGAPPLGGGGESHPVALQHSHTTAAH